MSGLPPFNSSSLLYIPWFWLLLRHRLVPGNFSFTLMSSAVCPLGWFPQAALLLWHSTPVGLFQSLQGLASRFLSVLTSLNFRTVSLGLVGVPKTALSKPTCQQTFMGLGDYSYYQQHNPSPPNNSYIKYVIKQYCVPCSSSACNPEQPNVTWQGGQEMNQHNLYNAVTKCSNVYLSTGCRYPVRANVVAWSKEEIRQYILQKNGIKKLSQWPCLFNSS